MAQVILQYITNLNIIYTIYTPDRLTKLVAEYYLVNHIAQIAKTLQNFNVPRARHLILERRRGLAWAQK